MGNNEKKYYLGLDVGTNSVGWCVTDDEYNVVRIKGKHLRGVRLFEESSSAKERRAYRTSRRRTRRKKERIDLLRQLLAEEINKVDPTFYQRLDESFFDYNDRTNKNLTTLFIDKDFTDKANFAAMELQKASEDTRNDYDFMLKFLKESGRKSRRCI